MIRVIESQKPAGLPTAGFPAKRDLIFSRNFLVSGRAEIPLTSHLPDYYHPTYQPTYVRLPGQLQRLVSMEYVQWAAWPFSPNTGLSVVFRRDVFDRELDVRLCDNLSLQGNGRQLIL
jgi:hypothetical protein